MKEQGFGLIEVLVSAALLMFMIAGTAQLFMASLGAKAGGDFAFAAARQAAALLERDKALPFDSPGLAPGTSRPPVEDATFPGRLEAVHQVEAAGDGRKKITVVISNRYAPWKKQSYCLMLCRELGF